MDCGVYIGNIIDMGRGVNIASIIGKYIGVYSEYYRHV
jgi:hypothetical protein